MRNKSPAVTGLTLSVLVVLAGCSGLLGLGGPQSEIGQEGGYGPTDPVNVTTGDGLNATEREAVVHRTMARVEAIRGLEFTSDVPVRVISRAQYRNQSGGFGVRTGPKYTAWNNQVWEAMFLVNERTNASNAVSGVYKGSVLGYYSNGEIVIVSDSETPRIDPLTLAHELTHALQDQQLNLGGVERTQDAQSAENGLIEGDANSVESRYQDRCANDSEWSCLPQPEQPEPGSNRTDYHEGVYTTVIMPYIEGEDFVDALYERGGWGTVNDAYNDIPQSSEQIIHPGRYPDDDPVNVTVENRSSNEWQRFDVQPQAETPGESSIYTMFWMNGVINHSSHQQYNYSHPLSTGWDGGRLVPYRNTADGQNGYVWKTTWDSPAEAKQFADGYKRLLERKNASRTGNTYVIPANNPYADAFRVTRDGRTVTIVNAPTADALDDVHQTTSDEPTRSLGFWGRSPEIELTLGSSGEPTHLLTAAHTRNLSLNLPNTFLVMNT